MHGDTESAMQVVKGSVTDRPWGLTLGALGVEARTVQLTLRAGSTIYRIVFDRGVVVAASSPHPVDTVTRVALTSHHIAPAQVNDLKRRIAASPNLDEIDVLAAAVRLTPEQARALRIRMVTQRAARTFSVDRGEYEIEDRAPLPAAEEGGIDVGSVIYLGARMNLSGERLAYDLRQLGSRFKLDPGTEDELSRFGLTRAEALILDALRAGTSLPELEAIHRDIDPRSAQAVVYALASCGVLRQLAQRAHDDHAEHAEHDDEHDDSIAARLAKGTSLERPTLRLDGDAVLELQATVPRSMLEAFRTGKATTVSPNALAAHDVEELIAERTALLDRGTDHFTLLGLSVGATVEDVHAAYVELARHLRPQRLTELGIMDEGFTAQRLLAQLGIAFTVLTDRIRRPEYLAQLQKARPEPTGEQDRRR